MSNLLQKSCDHAASMCQSSLSHYICQDHAKMTRKDAATNLVHLASRDLFRLFLRDHFCLSASGIM